jgi:hypothetical protein
MNARVWMSLQEELAADGQRSGHQACEGYPPRERGMGKSSRLGMIGIDETLVVNALAGGLAKRELRFIQISLGKL